MKNIIIISLLLVFSVQSCCKIDSRYLFCDVEDPMTELPWLMEKVNALHENENTQVSVYKIIYGEDHLEAFKIYSCNAEAVGSFPPCYFGHGFNWYNCNGEVICTMKYAFCDGISEERTHFKLIYQKTK